MPDYLTPQPIKHLPPQPIKIADRLYFGNIPPFTTHTTNPTPIHLHPDTEVGHITQLTLDNNWNLWADITLHTHYPLDLTQHTISGAFTTWSHTIPGAGHTWFKLESALLIPREDPETGLSVQLRAFPQVGA